MKRLHLSVLGLCPLVLAACGSTPVTPEPEERGPGGSNGAGTTQAEEAFRSLLSDMGVTYLPDQRALEVPGWVNMREGLVEVFACAPGGKTHEAVVVIDCVPSALHAGLIALGLEPGTPAEVGTDGEYRMPTGDGVVISLRWEDEAGAPRTARAEDWIWDALQEQSMPHCSWIFAGSFLQDTGKESQTYAANYIKSIVTTYHDASSILENPLSQGVDDTVYYSNDKAVPPVGTTVTVVFRPAG